MNWPMRCSIPGGDQQRGSRRSILRDPSGGSVDAVALLRFDFASRIEKWLADHGIDFTFPLYDKVTSNKGRPRR